MTQKQHPFGLRTIMELFDVGPGVAIGALSFAALVIVASVIYFVHSAPPSTITISTGPEGSIFQKNAEKYAAILKKNGVKLKVLTSRGSIENLERLNDPHAHVDVALAQGGTTAVPTEHLVSLGSVSYQPLLLFYRGKTLDLVSQLRGHKISIGPDGSGTRTFALAVLQANGIQGGDKTKLLDLSSEDAAKELMNRTIDAAFIMNESASLEILRKLIYSPEIRLFSFKQANAYSRKIEFLNILDLPEGAVDLGKNIPEHDITLVGPMVELVAKNSLHPALSDLLLEAASEVHGKPGVFQKRGDFPTPVEHAIRISDDANRFYKSGKSLLYRYLPFWLASLTSRIAIVFIPMLVVLFPILRSLPAFFRWRMNIKIRGRYRELLALEQEYLKERNQWKQEQLRERFDKIDQAVNRMKVPAAFADQFYGLRGHIDYVRGVVERQT